MTPLDSAIAQMEEEVASYNPGGREAPKEGTSGWYLLRATVLGLQYLRRIRDLEIHHDHGACERLYLLGSKHFKAAVPPEAPAIERETVAESKG